MRIFCRLGACIGVAAFACSAAAQVGLRIESSERIGDWEKATVAGGVLFVTAAPNTRAARAYCLSSHLNVPYDAMPGFRAGWGAEAERAGAARGYACLRLACFPGGAASGIEVSLVANAPPEPGETGMPLGVSLRLHVAAGERPLALFERADAGQRSPDGELALQRWSVSTRREGEEGPHVQVALSFAAPLSFVERLAANPRAVFDLGPGQDRESPVLKHGARRMEFAVAGTPAVIAELRRVCARPRGN